MTRIRVLEPDKHRSHLAIAVRYGLGGKAATLEFRHVPGRDRPPRLTS
jgi:hypothetical protein